MIIFILMFAFITLITFTVIRYENFQIAGISLTPEQLNTEEILECIKKYKQNTLVIFAVFVILALLSQWQFLRYYQDPYFLTIFSIGVFALYRNYVKFQQEVRQVVVEQLLSYNKHKVRSVDLAASRNKGKARPSKFVAWGIWSLTLIPIFFNMLADSTYTWLSILISLFLMTIPASYPYATRFRSTIISNDTQFNQKYQAQYERIKALSYLCVEVAIVIFTALIQLKSLTTMNVSLLLLFISLPLIYWWEGHEIKKLNQSVPKNFEWTINDNQPKTKYGFYFDPYDPRVLVPKISGSGVTFNIGTPLGKILAVLIGLVIIGSLAVVIVSTVVNYDVSLSDQTIAVDSIGYDDNVSFKDIKSVKLTNEPFDGIRTNGYGGFSHSYGTFNFDGYGDVRFYSTNENPYHIIVEQKESIEPKYLIFNLETPEQTNVIYESIQQNIE